MATIIQFRRDTAANWTAGNPILAQGEVGVEIDNLGTSLPVKEKIGDGVTAWDSLPYNITGGSGDVESVTGANVDNTDPSNPIINEPTLKTVGGESLNGSGNVDVVKSVSGDGVGGTSSNPVLSFPNADEVDDSGTSNKFTTQAEKDQITQNASFIGLLQTNKADQTALDSLASDVSTNAIDIDAVESDLSNKASQSDLTALDGRVSTNESDISTIQSDLSNKANQSDLDALDSRVTANEGNISTLQSDLSNKADQSDLNTLDGRVTQNETDITGKISISTVASSTEKGGVFLSYDAAANKLTLSTDNPI